MGVLGDWEQPAFDELQPMENLLEISRKVVKYSVRTPTPLLRSTRATDSPSSPNLNDCPTKTIDINKKLSIRAEGKGFFCWLKPVDNVSCLSLRQDNL